MAALQGFLLDWILNRVRWYKILAIINSILVHNRTRTMGFPGVSQYRSKRTKREPLACLIKTPGTRTTGTPRQLNQILQIAAHSIHVGSAILYLQASNARYLLPLVKPPTCYSLFGGVRLTKNFKMTLHIPPSLVRSRDQLKSRNQNCGRLSPSHTVTLSTVLGSDIPISGLVA